MQRENQQALLGNAGFVDLQRTQFGGVFIMITARRARARAGNIELPHSVLA